MTLESLDTEEVEGLTDKRIQEILGHRTEMYRNRGKIRQQENRVQSLVFRVSEDLYGVPISDLCGIHKISKISSIPRSHPALVGVTQIGGDVTSLLSLTSLLGKKAEPKTIDLTHNYALLLKHNDGLKIALLANTLETLTLVDTQLLKSAGDGKFVQVSSKDAVHWVDLKGLMKNLSSTLLIKRESKI
jgi:chemotaxis signal transduction protein